MAKYKTKTKDRTLIVKVKASLGEKINQNELNDFSRKYIRGLLRPTSLKRNYVEYTGPIGISLEERMKKEINRHDFFFIVEQVVNITQQLNMNNMNINQVSFDIKNVYINEATKEMQFIYFPLEEIKKGANIIGFLESIIYSVVQQKETDDDYISKFTYFLSGLKGYNPDTIEKYILKQDKAAVYTIKRHGAGQSGFMTDKPKDYYDHYNKNEEATGFLDENEERTGILNEAEEATGFLDEIEEATGLLNETEEATGILKPDIHSHYAAIQRLSTKEDIPINKPVFRIGKEARYSDYCVSDNDKVSRSHADIITRNGRYFVNDLNSRNGTYINGQMIAVKQETEIFDGNILKLANEEFVFHT